MTNIKFSKYHGLGNDYIVIDKKFAELSKKQIIKICDVHYGIGSDGILVDNSDGGRFSVKILNPDGSEAEKSGNGLRIFSRYLFDKGDVKLGEKFEIRTLGGNVSSTVIDRNSVTVEMGQVKFLAINETIVALEREFVFCWADVGNPHCVIVLDEISPELTRKYGAAIENDKRFPNRTNVQFVKIIDKNNIQIEIWERGAGYTLASGSSSTAAASVAHKLGLCDNKITVKMPGGELRLSFSEDFFAEMSGAVQRIGSGEIDAECFQ